MEKHERPPRKQRLEHGITMLTYSIKVLTNSIIVSTDSILVLTDSMMVLTDSTIAVASAWTWKVRSRQPRPAASSNTFCVYQLRIRVWMTLFRGWG